MEPRIGDYEVSRIGWRCNLCGHMTYKDKITHRCNNAPHFLGSETIGVIKRGNLAKVKALLKL